MKVCVIGAGSIGIRHIKNLYGLKHKIIVVETDKRKAEILWNSGYDVAENLNEINIPIDFVIIAVPTSSHIPIAQTAVNLPGIKGIFIEKPLSYNMDGVDTLINVCKENNIKLMCGCNLRFWNGTVLVKTLLNNETIGKPLCVDYTFGDCIKNWHPGTDYTKSYSAGEHGGILLDDIHAIDLVEHLFGEISDISGRLIHTGELNISKEDIAEYNFTTKNGLVGRIHSDYLNIEYTRNMYITGTKGNIIWDFAEGEVLLRTPAIDKWRVFNVKEPLNEMYIREMSYFIECIQKDINPITNGRSSLKLACMLKEKNI